jgi:hypothetical protein
MEEVTAQQEEERISSALVEANVRITLHHQNTSFSRVQEKNTGSFKFDTQAYVYLL